MKDNIATGDSEMCPCIHQFACYEFNTTIWAINDFIDIQVKYTGLDGESS